MKICEKCFAEYDDAEVAKSEFCIECYGEDIDTKVIDKQEFLERATLDLLVETKNRIEMSSINEQHKWVLLKRIKRLIEEKLAEVVK